MWVFLVPARQSEKTTKVKVDEDEEKVVQIDMVGINVEQKEEAAVEEQEEEEAEMRICPQLLEQLDVYFDRYDLDQSGTLNSTTELRQVCINLMFSFPECIKVSDVEGIYGLCDAMNLNDMNVMTSAQFVQWFYKKLYKYGSTLPGSPGAQPKQATESNQDEQKEDEGEGVSTEQKDDEAVRQRQQCEDEAATEVLDQLEAMEEEAEAGSPKPSWGADAEAEPADVSQLLQQASGTVEL